MIDQLEPTKRGLYGGACGYLSYSGDMDVAITIRTGIIMDQRFTCRPPLGGGRSARTGVERNRGQGAARAVSW
jgi:anthranilate synthase component 1